MRLLITGCARSGTTLMTHLMRYFYNCQVVIDKEDHPYNYHHYNDTDNVLVIKKPAVTLNDMDYFDVLSPAIIRGWKIIWMIRDGRDVIVSKNHLGQYHCSADRWVATNEDALNFILKPNVLIVRYEDLVTDPKSQMEAIKEFIGQNYQEDFNDFWQSMDTESNMNVGIVPRQVDANSVGKWKEAGNKKVIAEALKDRKFVQLLKLFNYK